MRRARASHRPDREAARLGARGPSAAARAAQPAGADPRGRRRSRRRRLRRLRGLRHARRARRPRPAAGRRLLRAVRRRSSTSPRRTTSPTSSCASFDRVVWRGLGLDRHPELREDYFRHYERVVWLAQRRTPELTVRAEAAAEKLGLPLEIRDTGDTALEHALERLLQEARTRADQRAPEVRDPRRRVDGGARPRLAPDRERARHRLPARRGGRRPARCRSGRRRAARAVRPRLDRRAGREGAARVRPAGAQP